MQAIRETILKQWYKHTSDIEKQHLRTQTHASVEQQNIAITGYGLRQLYILYDKYAFHYQLSERLVYLNQINAYKTILSFDQSGEKFETLSEKTKDSHKSCGICYWLADDSKLSDVRSSDSKLSDVRSSDSKLSNVRTSDKKIGGVTSETSFVKVLLFRLSPWIISRLANVDSAELERSFKTTSIGMTVLLAFEHMLTHLIFIMWEHEGHYDTIHNPLFKCVHNSFFNDRSSSISTKNYDIVNLLTLPNSYPQPTIHSIYAYNDNSCYIDSLLTILFFSDCNTFRNAIFTTNVDDINYKREFAQRKFMLPWDESITERQFIHITQMLQSELFFEYMHLIKSGSSNDESSDSKCTNIRETIVKLYSDIRSSHNSKKGLRKKNSGYKMYSSPDIYDLLCHCFPILMCHNHSYTIANRTSFASEEGVVRTEVSKTPRSMFTFWEFMEPAGLKNIVWGDIDCDVLVFRNGGIPAIQNYGDISSEIIKVPTYKNGKVRMIKETITKSQVFGEYIINNKYVMVGVIMLYGVEPGKSGGSHYVAYVKTKDGWMFYNDIGSVWKLTGTIRSVGNKRVDTMGNFPLDVLNEKEAKPEMYFYAKVTCTT